MIKVNKRMWPNILLSLSQGYQNYECNYKGTLFIQSDIDWENLYCCKKAGHPGEEVRSHMYILAHTSAKPYYLSLREIKSVIYLKPLYYYYDRKI
jgi:hypothetical protein